MNSFSKIIGILITVILMFIYPLLYSGQKQDMISQIYVSNATTEYIDNIKNKGYLTNNMLHSFVKRIEQTGNVYNLEMIHCHKQLVPDYDGESGEFLNKYKTHYYNIYQDEIYDVLDQGESYHFTQGDLVSIKVVNRNKTLATIIMEKVFNSPLPVEQIIVTYGGAIRDEAD